LGGSRVSRAVVVVCRRSMAFRFPAKSQHQGGGRPPAPARMSSVFRRLLVRVTPAERLDGKAEAVAGGDAEVGSVALDRMVLSFMEESAAAVERPPRGRCNCFNGQDASDDDDEGFEFLPSSAAATAAAGDALELLKVRVFSSVFFFGFSWVSLSWVAPAACAQGLVQCASTEERNLLADASRLASRHGLTGGGRKTTKAEARRAVAAGLRALGYDAAVCRSRWEKGASYPAGEHEYIDALLLDAARVVVEVDFRAEFEVARPTKAYRAALQALPPLFVGAPDRLGRVVAVVAEAARQSLRKRGLHFPPWRKPEYMRAKWLARHARDDATAAPVPAAGEFELQFREKVTAKAAAPGAAAGQDGDKEEEVITVGPEAGSKQIPQSPQTNTAKVITGLACVL
jgi:uncharacterized protein (TIGR01615 family)